MIAQIIPGLLRKRFENTASFLGRFSSLLEPSGFPQASFFILFGGLVGYPGTILTASSCLFHDPGTILAASFRMVPLFSLSKTL